MAVIYSAIIPIRINNDLSIDILKEFKEEVKKCGCVDVSAAAKRLNVSVADAHTAARQLAGDAEISCDPEGKYCCTDEKRLVSFMDALRSLRGV